MEAPVKIYTARKIHTLYPEHPQATAVAVKEGRILGVGELAELTAGLDQSIFSEYQIDSQFQDKILLPGLVDAHTHVEIQAVIYSGHFVAQIPWPNPEGGLFPTYPTKADVIERLKRLDRQLPPDEPLYAVAYDENKVGDLRLDELDAISTTRPILVSNLVFHRFWANSALLEKAGIRPGRIPDGVQIDDAGKPNGCLIEATGLMAVIAALPEFFNHIEEKIARILPLFTAAGCTTVCDAALGSFGLEQSLGFFSTLFEQYKVGLRIVGLPWASAVIQQGGSPQDFIAQVEAAAAQATDRFRIGAAKLYTDGSLISRTAPAGWPGYWDGTKEGKMACSPQIIHNWLIELHKAGIPTVTHTNTAAGCQVVLDAVKDAQRISYRPDMRHRMDHCYTITEAQLRQAKALGVTIQFFTPQLYYYGESHRKLLGPTRANHLTPVGTARRLGVSWGFHNDPPGTPQLPWVGAHAVINRVTRETNEVFGPEHRAPVEDTIRAMTIEAAYQMHLDHEIGSIEPGKKADFCVLEKDPFEIDPLEIKDMLVWGTVFGGEPQIKISQNH